MLGPGEIFTLFFVTLGPLKVLGPFAQRTAGLDRQVARQIAVRAFAIATAAIIVGSIAGRALAARWSISLAALELTAGIVFFIVAVKHLLEQYEPAPSDADASLPPAANAAALRIVFPIVLTPYGIAAVITVLAATQDAGRTLSILALLVAVMVLNLLAMVFARHLMTGMTLVVLQVLGAVLAVLQVALAVQIVIVGLQRLDALAS